MPRRRSFIWKYFSKTNEDVANCKNCFKSIRICGNTSNMMKHLKTHPNCFPEPSKAKQALLDNSSVTKSAVASTSIPTLLQPHLIASKSHEGNIDTEQLSFSPSTSKKRQISLQETVARRSSFAEGGDQHALLTKSLLYFICADKRPFEVVKGKGFQKLLKNLRPAFKIPGTDLLRSRLDTFYDIMSKKTATSLITVPHVSLTCDIWTETMSCRSFLGVTVHYIQENFLKSRVITVAELNERHTSAYIMEKLEEACCSFNIRKEKVKCVVTDNGANIVAAVSSFVGKEHHIPCFAHTINLIAEHILKLNEFSDLCDKVRNIVKFFKSSVINSDKLRANQIGSPLKLILDVKTRWNSVYYMLERYLELSSIIHPLLYCNTKSPAVPTPIELETLKQVCKVLKPLEYVTKELSGEQYATISKVIPIVKTLNAKMTDSVPTDYEVTKQLKKTILEQVKRRFGDIENNLIISISCILDPRFKALPFINRACVTKAIQFLIESMPDAISTAGTSIESCETNSQGDSYDFWDHYKDLAHKTGNIDEEKYGIKEEIANYLKTKVLSLHSDPIAYWEENKNVYPLLFKASQEYLHIPATSVPSERLFSRAGSTITQDRNRLTGSRLNKLLFLSDCSEDEWDI